MGRIGKKVLSCTLCLMMAVGMLPGMTRKTKAAAEASDGIKLVDGVYQISTYADLKEFAAIVNEGNSKANAILLRDIDAAANASDQPWVPIGTNIRHYVGIFDGNGKKITGLTINNSSLDYAGLFGYVGQNGTVQNVGLEGGSIIGNNYIGGVAGVVFNATVTNCYNKCTVSGNTVVGGVVGYIYGGTISNCYNINNVVGKEDRIGGVVGFCNGGTLSNCFNSGAVTKNTESDGKCVGGVVGYCSKGTIVNCFNSAAVTGTGSFCYIGGVLGNNQEGNLSNSYNCGSVSGEGNNCNVGGVVGLNNAKDTNAISYCYYDESICIGIHALGYGNSGDCVKGMTTAQMTGMAALDNMKFSLKQGEESPWMVRANDEFYSYYPRLKGFDKDADGSQLAPEAIGMTDWTPRKKQPDVKEISNYRELKDFSSNINTGGSPTLKGILLNDIDASASSSGNIWIPIGKDSSHPYKGIFDGNGKKITGLTVKTTGNNPAGFFGMLDEGATVRNVGLEGGAITGYYYAGGVVGQNNKGSVINCYNSCTVSGQGKANNRVGGVVGENFSGNVINCYNTGTVIGLGGEQSFVGGVVGYNIGKVSYCYNTGDVTGNENLVGGVVGFHSVKELSYCYNTGTVTETGDNSALYAAFPTAVAGVGGVAGCNCGSRMRYCYNTGTVIGNKGCNVGGIVGFNEENKMLMYCYSTGVVTAKGDDCSLGGVVGRSDYDSKVNSCFYDKSICPMDAVGVGNYKMVNTKGLTTTQMTGLDALTNMSLLGLAGDDSPWLIKSDSKSVGKTYWHYPHLKGFAYDSENSEENWPSKVEVKVTWNDPESYTYDGSEKNPTVTSIIVGDDTIPEGADSVTYSVYTAAKWGEATTGEPTSPGQYKMEYSTAEKVITKFFTILSPVENYDVSYYSKSMGSDWLPSTECINVGEYMASITFLVPIEEDKVVKYVPEQGEIITKEFTILQRELTIQAASEAWTYDGAAHSNNTVTITKGSLADGDELSATATGAVTFVSDTKEGNNPVSDDVKVMRGTENVTGNYEITKVAGTLSITPATIIITADSASKEYDGTALTKDSVSAEGLATGDKIESITVTGSQTVAWKSDNTPSEAKIVNADGEDVTKCYKITYVNGTLEVTKKALTITADSDTKVYDKTALTKDSYTVYGLADGDSIKSVAIAGSQTMKGSSDNVPSKAVIVNAKGEDVTSSYDITYKNGTLTVTASDAPALSDNQKPVPKNDLKEDGKEQVLVLAPANLPEGYTIEYSTDGGKTWVSVPTGKESGEYTIEVFYKADENHTDFFGEALKVTIKAEYTVVWMDGDGKELDKKTYTEGTTEPKTEKIPVKTDEKNNYTFAKWDDGTVSGKTKTYQPVFSSLPKELYKSLLGTVDWQNGSNESAEYQIKRAVDDMLCHELFTGEVYVDGNLARRGIDYTDRTGSTIISFKPEYLKTLAIGSHMIKVVFKDGETSVVLNILAAPAVDTTPTTGDTSMPIFWAALILLSMAGASVVVMRRRKRA